MTEALEARLQVLEETSLALSILPKYAAAVDSADLDAVLDLFADNGVLHSPRGDFAGRAAIAGFFRDAWAADPSRKRHFVTNTQPRWISAGQVAIDAYFLYTGRSPADSVLGWGSYRAVVDVSAEPKFLDIAIGVEVGTTLTDGWADKNDQEANR